MRFWKRRRVAADDPTAFGAILLEHGWLTQEQLDTALCAQSKGNDAKLGAVCVALGFITDEQRGDALWEHRLARGRVRMAERIERAERLSDERQKQHLSRSRNIQILADELALMLK